MFDGRSVGRTAVQSRTAYCNAATRRCRSAPVRRQLPDNLVLSLDEPRSLQLTAHPLHRAVSEVGRVDPDQAPAMLVRQRNAAGPQLVE